MTRSKLIALILLLFVASAYSLHRVTGPIEDRSGRWSGSLILYSVTDDVNDVVAIEELDDLTDFVAGTDDIITVTDDGDGTITLDVVNVEDADFGDITVLLGVWSLDPDTVEAENMADDDHGDVSWTSNVATVEDFTLNTNADAGDYNIANIGILYADALYADATALVLGAGTETIAINSSDWDIGTTGNMTGIGSITADGTILTTANAITLGDGSAGDPVLTFNSGNDLTITWEEDGKDIEIGTADSVEFTGGSVTIIAGSGTTGSIAVQSTDSWALLAADTDVYIDLDNDNDGTENLYVRDGAEATIFQITEAGAVTAANSITAGSLIRGSAFYGRVDASLSVISDTDLYLEMDNDNDSTSYTYFRNGADVSVAKIDEDGDVTLGGNLDDDPSITFDGDTSDGVINYDEDNSTFEFNRATTIGDGGTTNYASFAADGELNLVGTARVYINEWFDTGNLKAPGTKPATFVESGISGGWEFTDGTDDTIVAVRRIPQWMDRTAAPQIKLGWFSDTADPGDDSKQVVWQVEYLWRAQNEDMTAAADGTLPVTTSASTTADGLVISTVTLAAPGSTDQLLLLRIKRLGADGDDDLGDDCILIGVGLKATCNRLGEPL